MLLSAAAIAARLSGNWSGNRYKAMVSGMVRLGSDYRCDGCARC
jgi:hypothetical protein